MKLEHIKEEVCPDCGEGPEREEKRNRHANGMWNEQRKFSCGCIISFSPSFGECRASIPCPNSPEEKKAKEQKRVATARLTRYIRHLDAPAEWREDILSRIRWMLED